MKRALILILVMHTAIIYGQSYSGGSGTSVDPYIIHNKADLKYLCEHTEDWYKQFKQDADIVFTTADFQSGGDFRNGGNGFIPLGNSTKFFNGSYDGDYHTISNLYINRSSTNNVGMFGLIYSTTKIKNLGIINADITGGDGVGGLVGYSYPASISNCYTTGTINGSHAGGLIGYNNGTISNCYSLASVSGSYYIGGFAAYNTGTLTNCYSAGSVNGSSYAKGLVSLDYSGTYDNAFWDTETSGKSSSSGGTGITTVNMKTESTFTTAGWDFSGETTNGNNDYWSRDDNKNGGYPYLSWQTFPQTSTFTNGSSFNQSVTQGQTDQAIGRFALKANADGATFDGVWIQLNGTRTGVSNFKLWESSDNSFSSGSDTQIGSTVSSDPGDGNYVWFLSLSKSLVTTDKYYFITCDLASDASGTIELVIPGNKELMFGSSVPGSTLNNASLSNGTSPLPVELTSFNATVKGNSVNLSWETATEVNNYGFQVQRKKIKDESEEEWEDIGFVQGNGTTNSPKYYEFTDFELPNSETVSYRLKQIDNDGTYSYSKTITVDLTTITDVNGNELPKVYSLSQNYPNPFNPTTTIKFGLPEAGFVDLRVFNMLGEEVAQLVSNEMRAGYHEVNFDASNLSSGMYIYKLTSGKFAQTKKLMLLK